MKKAITVITLGLVLTVAAVSLAKLDPEEQGKVDALAETLKLDAVQKAKVSEEREASKKALLRLESKWQQQHDRLRREVRKDNPDAAAIGRITREIGAIRGQIVELRTNSLVFLKSILNPEQKKILKQNMSGSSETGSQP